MKTILINTNTAMVTAIAMAFSESTEAETIEEPYPSIPYVKTDYPAYPKIEKVKDWEQPRSRNQYKQKRRR
jgi:hypothetical protein